MAPIVEDSNTKKQQPIALATDANASIAPADIVKKQPVCLPRRL